MPPDRRQAAALVRRYLAQELTFDEVIAALGDSDDPLIAVTVFGLAHEPRRGFLGVSERRWRRRFREPLQQLLDELDKGPEGTPPPLRPIPHVTPLHVVGWALFTLAACVFTADHVYRIALLFVTESELPVWRLLFHSFAIAVMALSAVAGFGAMRYRLLLYRTRRLAQ